MKRLVRRLLPGRTIAVIGLAGLGGCFATRNDVRIMQGDVAQLRAELLRNDAEHKEAMTVAVRLLQAVSDSVARANARLTAVQGDVRTETRAIKDQLLLLQNLFGQNTAAMAKLRAQIEDRPTVSPVAVDSAAPQSTGPFALYTTGLNQIRAGSTTTGRGTLTELISTYPNFENIAEAKYYVASSYQQEKNYAAAETAYAGVVAEFPDSKIAPSALYKRALVFQLLNNPTRARELFGQVVSRYPKSDEAAFAADQLRQR